MAPTEERFLDLMAVMTEKQTKDSESKVAAKLADMKRDMFLAVKEVSDCQNELEHDQKELMSKLHELQAKVQEMEVSFANVCPSLTIKDFASLAAPSARISTVAAAAYQGSKRYQDELEKNFSVQHIADLARRTIGLKPFNQSDIDAEIRRGAKNENEAKMLAVETYLRYEMSIRKHTMETLTIEKIFSPDKEDWSVLYVTFKTTEDASTVYSYARNMRKEAHVGSYIPKEFYNR